MKPSRSATSARQETSRAGLSIGNLTRRDKFLFRHSIRLGHETSASQLRYVLGQIRKMMVEQGKLEPGTVKARLIRFGNDSLYLQVTAYVPTRDEGVFLDLQEELLLRIMDIVEASGVSFSVPPGTPGAPSTFALTKPTRDIKEA